MMCRANLIIVCAILFLYRVPIPIIRAIELQDGFWDPLCPRCKNAIDREFVRYCSCCGQRVSWILWDKYIKELSPSQTIFYEKVLKCCKL